jgi:hypothetical protein
LIVERGTEYFIGGIVSSSPISSSFEDASPIEQKKRREARNSWILTGDPTHDNKIREEHGFPGSPSINFAKNLLELCYNTQKVINSFLEFFSSSNNHHRQEMLVLPFVMTYPSYY